MNSYLATLERDHVGVIGGGASGTLLAYHLLLSGARVTLYEPSARLGRGLAYGVDSEEFSVNVPVRGLSCSTQQPGDFLAWLQERGKPWGAGDFVPRRWLGQYLEFRLRQADTGLLRVIAQPVQGIERVGGQLEVVDGAGGRESFANVVLALGNRPPAGEFLNPWDEKSYVAIKDRENLLLVGTGLSAVDVIARAESGGFRGNYLAVSRRGLAPLQHLPSEAVPRLDLGPPHLRSWLRKIRSAARVHPWRAVIDSLRPRTQELWRSLTPAERAQFLRHLRPYWDVHRHRLPPQAGALVASLVESGRLTFVAGRLRREQGRWSLQPRRGGLPLQLSPDAVFSCTGPASLEESRGPLLSSLLDAGLASLDDTGLGLRTADDGRVLDRRGHSELSLYALGPLRRGELWESTAIPELRAQAEDLAGLLTQVHKS